jgi:hypothetical protein
MSVGRTTVWNARVHDLVPCKHDSIGADAVIIHFSSNSATPMWE